MKIINTIKSSGCPESDGGMHYEARCADRIKLLFWDGQGFCLYYNDLHSYYISLSGSVEGFSVFGVFLMAGDAIDELVPSTALLLR